MTPEELVHELRKCGYRTVDERDANICYNAAELLTAAQSDSAWRHDWHERLGRGEQTEGKFYAFVELALDIVARLKLFVDKERALRDQVDNPGGQHTGYRPSISPSVLKELERILHRK